MPLMLPYLTDRYQGFGTSGEGHPAMDRSFMSSIFMRRARHNKHYHVHYLECQFTSHGRGGGQVCGASGTGVAEREI